MISSQVASDWVPSRCACRRCLLCYQMGAAIQGITPDLLFQLDVHMHQGSYVSVCDKLGVLDHEDRKYAVEKDITQSHCLAMVRIICVTRVRRVRFSHNSKAQASGTLPVWQALKG